MIRAAKLWHELGDDMTAMLRFGLTTPVNLNSFCPFGPAVESGPGDLRKRLRPEIASIDVHPGAARVCPGLFPLQGDAEPKGSRASAYGGVSNSRSPRTQRGVRCEYCFFQLFAPAALPGPRSGRAPQGFSGLLRRASQFGDRQQQDGRVGACDARGRIYDLRGPRSFSYAGRYRRFDGSADASGRIHPGSTRRGGRSVGLRIDRDVHAASAA